MQDSPVRVQSATLGVQERSGNKADVHGGLLFLNPDPLKPNPEP